MTDIVGLAGKVDIALIAEIPIVEIPSVTKTDVEGSDIFSVDEVLVTFFNEVLSWTCEKID